MHTEHERCYAAMVSRDPRFDGRFFSGISTTGIYCRPICPARTPARENVRFFPSAAAAEAAGFRACLRCRPETAPGAPAWSGTAATVTRAMRLLRDGAMVHGVPALAERLGIGPRHLRRLFQEHLGASPMRVAQSLRLDSTRLLLAETQLPMAEVCRLAGFKSVRRFNAAVLTAFGRSPTALRARGGRAQARGPLCLHLAYRPPFAWHALLDFLHSRAPGRVERVTQGTWQRVLGREGAAGVVSVSDEPERSRLRVEVPAVLVPQLSTLVPTLRRIFDLDADPAAILGVLGASPLLGPTLRRMPGLRIPGAVDGWELAIRAILGQQISVAAANTLFSRVVERWGVSVDTGVAGLDRLFPAPEVLRDAPFEQIGVTGARSVALREISAAAAEGRLDLQPRATLEQWIEGLCKLRGIGPWTAHYLALRAAGEPDAFPASDLGLRRAGRVVPVSARDLLAEAESWRPWRGYAAIALWNHGRDDEVHEDRESLRPGDGGGGRPGTPGGELRRSRDSLGVGARG